MSAFSTHSTRRVLLCQRREARCRGRPYGSDAAQYRDAARVMVVAVRGIASRALRGARDVRAGGWRDCGRRLARADVQQLAVLGTDPMLHQREVQRLKRWARSQQGTQRPHEQRQREPATAGRGSAQSGHQGQSRVGVARRQATWGRARLFWIAVRMRGVAQCWASRVGNCRGMCSRCGHDVPCVTRGVCSPQATDYPDPQP